MTHDEFDKLLDKAARAREAWFAAELKLSRSERATEVLRKAQANTYANYRKISLEVDEAMALRRHPPALPSPALEDK